LGALLRQTLGNDVADPVAAVLETATAPEARGRYATVVDFVEAWGIALDQHGLDAAPATYTPTRNPYKGLASFQEADAKDFHGRGDVVETLVDAVARNRLVAVVGPSGIGKSSVVRAGLIPALRGDALAGSASWLITDMIPGAYPFESLGSALLRIADHYPTGLDEELRADRRGLLRAATRLLPDGSDALLVIDQFEELFTLAAEPTAAERFLDALTDLISDPEGNVRVLVTLRADFFDRPLRHPEFGDLLRAATVPVSAPTGDALIAIVERPAANVGIGFESGLAERVVRDVAGQPAALPLLEFTLTELFAGRTTDTLTLSSYEAGGGVLGALANRAEGVYSGLDDEEQEVTRHVMMRLVSIAEASDATRRRVRRSELDRLDVSSTAVDSVLAEFGAARLLAFDRDPATRGPTVEVAHESLFTEWERLEGWIASHREDLVLSGRLSATVEEWEAADRDDTYLVQGGRLAQFEEWAESTDLVLTFNEDDYLKASREAEDARIATRRRRRLLVMGGFGMAAAIALLLAVVALIARSDVAQQAELAEEQARIAEEAAAQAELATLISRSAEVSDDRPAVSLLLALEAHRRAPTPETERAVLDALSRNRLGTRVATLDLAGKLGWLSGDGLAQTYSTDGRMIRRSLATGEIVDVGALPEPDAAWVGDQATDHRFASSLDFARFWFGPYDGPWVQVDPDEPMALLTGRTFPTNRLVFQTLPGPYIGDGVWEVRGEGLSSVVLLDATTGQPVGTPIEGMVDPWAVVSPDNRLIAVRSRPASTFGGAGAVFVLDALSGEELFHVEVSEGVEGMVFDSEAGELLAGTGDGQLITIDLIDQEVVAQVETNATSQIIDVGLRQDGRVVVVSEGLAEMVDRQTGSIPGSGIELRNVISAAMRSDDTLIVFTSADQGEFDVEIHDFDGGALVEQALDVGETLHVDLGPELAAVANVGEALERIDLATGGRSTELLMPQDFNIALHFAEPGGVIGWSPDMSVARWESGQLTERISAASQDGVAGRAGAHTEGREAIVGERPDGTDEVVLVNTEPGEFEVLLTVAEADDAVGAYPAPGDGLYVMLSDGRLRTYDSSGSMTSEIPTGLFNLSFATGDETSGRLAFGGFWGELPTGAVIVDPASSQVQVLPDVGRVANLRFVRDGELLVVISLDGTVRLWDVESGEFAGVIWDGTGANPGNALTYDEATDSLWLFSSGRLLRLPLDPDRWAERACEIAARDLTQEEWDRYVPGDEPLQTSCS
jgi:WD40 repeat protein